MKLKDKTPARPRDPDLTSLINIVFLILIFFIVAGTLRPFSQADIQLAKTTPDTAGVPAPARLIVSERGTITHNGREVLLAELDRILSSVGAGEEAKSQPFIIVADGRLNAPRLLDIARAVRQSGFSSVSILTEKRKDP